MRSTIHIHRPIERTHELDVIGLDITRERILFFKDPHASQTAPLMRSRMRPARIFRRSPEGFGRRVRPHASGFIERDSEIVAQGGLTKLAKCSGIFVALQTPFT